MGSSGSGVQARRGVSLPLMLMTSLMFAVVIGLSWRYSVEDVERDHSKRSSKWSVKIDSGEEGERSRGY